VKYFFLGGGGDDGGTEGPERGTEARSAEGVYGVAVAPPQYGGLGLCPRKIFKKSTSKSRIFGS